MEMIESRRPAKGSGQATSTISGGTVWAPFTAPVNGYALIYNFSISVSGTKTQSHYGAVNTFNIINASASGSPLYIGPGQAFTASGSAPVGGDSRSVTYELFTW